MKKALLLIWILTAVVAAQAQTRLVFEETTSAAYLIRQTPAGNNSQANSNSIISLLNDGNTTSGKGGRPSRKPEYVVRFEQHARIADAGEVLQLKVQLQNVSVTGDMHYKGFDIASTLLPENISLTVKLLNSQNSEVKRYTLQSLNFSKNGAVALETTVPDTAAAQGYTLQIEGMELLYSSNNVRLVQEQINLIKDYYVADATLNKALQDIARINPEDIDRIKLQDRNLREMEDELQQLQEKRFAEKLHLNQYDPQRYTSKTSQLSQQLKERRRAINHTLATLDQQFYNRGIGMLTKGNPADAQGYFVKSLEVNPRFAPAHLQLARLDFMGGNLREAAGRTRDILTQMRVDPETEQMALGLAHDIYSAFVTEGHNFNSRGDYRSALVAYADARALCNTLGGLRCNMPALNDGEGRAVYGHYRGLVGEGKRLLSRNELEKADQVADEAFAFQRQYDYVLHDAPEAAELQDQVKYQFYVQHIDRGRQSLKEKNYRNALSQFEAALALEQAYTFKPVRELGGLAQQAAKPVLLSQLSDGYAQAMNNRLSDARAVATAAAAMQNRYALEKDTEVQAKYTQLRDRIFTQECLNIQAEYDRHYQNARALVSERKFLAADQAYQTAIKAASSKNTCLISTIMADDGIAAIAPAVAYQRMLEDVSRFVATGRYTEAIRQYDEAEKHYLGQSISRFGLDHISLFNYAKEQNMLAFTASVVSHFATIREEQAALQLLTSLLDKGYSKGKTKKVQQQLGKQLAAKDAALNLSESPKVLATSYTQGDKKLRNLGKAYEKERKRLAKG